MTKVASCKVDRNVILDQRLTGAPRGISVVRQKFSRYDRGAKRRSCMWILFLKKDVWVAT